MVAALVVKGLAGLLGFDSKKPLLDFYEVELIKWGISPLVQAIGFY